MYRGKEILGQERIEIYRTVDRGSGKKGNGGPVDRDKGSLLLTFMG